MGKANLQCDCGSVLATIAHGKQLRFLHCGHCKTIYYQPVMSLNVARKMEQGPLKELREAPEEGEIGKEWSES